jgi:hypothetical protein
VGKSGFEGVGLRRFLLPFSVHSLYRTLENVISI